jgi:NodT family efflux transporter outer membrane factor (OMF) lipoprotein
MRVRSSAIACVGFLLGASALTGCTVGPDFLHPDPPRDRTYNTPETSIERTASADVLGGEAQHFVAGLDIPAQWWQVFQSKPLDGLIQQSMRANPDIQTAIQSLKVAQQTARVQRAALFPVVSSSMSGTQNGVSVDTSGNGQGVSSTSTAGNTVFGLFTGLLNVSYLIDIWGGTRRAAESAEATAESQCFLLEAAYLTLASNVVVAAITEASLRAQIATIERTIQIQRETLKLLQARLSFGQAAVADVATQQAALAQAEATLPPLRNQLSQQRHLLAQLTGQTAAHEPAASFELDSLTLPKDLPVSVPWKMIEQRPDVRSAEASVHSAAAGVGVATAAFLPQPTFNLIYGQTVFSSDQLFNPLITPTYTVGASVVQTIFEGGALIAKRRAAVAAWEQAQSQYRSTVLTAFRNVADSLRAIEFDALTLAAATNAEHAARLSLDIIRRRLAAGDAGILDILNAEATYQTALQAQVTARAARFSDTAGLFQALGGGWWNRDEHNQLAPAKRAECRAPANPPKPRPWPDTNMQASPVATGPSPSSTVATEVSAPSTPPAAPSKSSWGWLFGRGAK